MSLELLYKQKKIKNYQKILSKGFGRVVHWNECKTKIETKNATNQCRYFLESSFVGVDSLFVLAYLN